MDVTKGNFLLDLLGLSERQRGLGGVVGREGGREVGDCTQVIPHRETIVLATS